MSLRKIKKIEEKKKATIFNWEFIGGDIKKIVLGENKHKKSRGNSVIYIFPCKKNQISKNGIL